jgi:hypothetical protein
MSNAATAADRWVKEIEGHVLTCQQIMAKAAADCGKYKTFISEAKTAAKNEGVGTKALNALLLERKHLRNAANVRAKLEDDDLIAELEMLRDQVKPVEGLELFKFAAEQIDGEIAKAKGKTAEKVRKKKAAAIDSLTDDLDDKDFDPRLLHLKSTHEQIDAEEAAAVANAKAIQDNIKHLN